MEERGGVLPNTIVSGLCVAMKGRGRGLPFVMEWGEALYRFAVLCAAYAAAVAYPFVFLFWWHCLLRVLR